MVDPLNILVIEDRNADFLMVERHLRQNDLSARCRRVDSLEGLREAIARESWDLVLADYNVPQLNFPDGLNLMRAMRPDLPVIMVTGSLGEEKAVELLKLGVCDFILKDRLLRLVPAIERCLRDKAEHHDKRAAVEALQLSEELYRSLFSNMLNGFAYCRVIFDGSTPLDFVYMKVNDEFERQTGLKNVMGKKVTELLPGIKESDPEFFERYCRVALTGKPDRFEIYVKALENWFSVSAYSPTRGYFIALFDVITERKLAEKALRESEERLDLALRGANDGLWDRNLKSDEVYFSPRWKAMLGYAEEELENHIKTWEGLLHPEDLESTLTRLRDYLEGRTPRFEAEFRMLHKDGSYVHILSRGFLLYDDSGEASRMVGTHVDVTERKKLEVQFRQAQKMEVIGQLAGGIAHDFNNILTAIIGFGYLAIMKMAPDDPQRANIDHMLEGAERASNLTKDLLIFSRKQVSERRPVDLNEIIRKVEKFLVRVIGEDINCSLALSGEQIVVNADTHQLEQVLMNLATNARDAMAKGGGLVISSELTTIEDDYVTLHGYGKPGKYALLTISDTGEGMDEETRRKIFEPFFTTKEAGKGTGLGLAVVYGIIKQHVGFINVYSEPGSGTSFKIYLPIISLEVSDEKVALEAETPAQGTETILLVEDDQSVRELVSIILKQQGYTVIEAVDGENAVKKFMENRDTIHLLISDLIMPKMNGIEAYDEMKVWRPELKAIFASGYAPDIFRQKMSIENGVELIYKPIMPHALLKKVRTLLDEGEKQDH